MTSRQRAADAPILHGRRQGRRLRPARKALLGSALPQHALALPEDGRLEPASWFGFPVAALWLEVGFGNGEHLAEQALAHPEIGFIGCEPFLNGVSMLLKLLEAGGQKNVRILADDARPLLARLPEASLQRVSLLFPDPWPKSRHHRRRFIGPETLDQLARCLADGGELRTATDHAELGRHMLFQALRHPAFLWPARRAADWRERPADECSTRYEGKALSAGRSCIYLRFVRRPRAQEKTP